MQGTEKDVQMRAYILDSLSARYGQVLNPALINEISAEILERMIEIHEAPVFQIEAL